MIGEHSHTLSDPGHTHRDRGHNHRYQDFGQGNWEGDNADDRAMTRPDFTTRTTEKGYANLMTSRCGISIGRVTTSGVSLLEVGQEVRPKSMLVRWIIKIL
eukprot:TRINITY_DN38556_c0_g1_i1.p1 TRINITY_DN38556_c0_g1~~TRINITY_DN38556_c0_g1_i1.p1  ORF type:complete len:101 (-),score=4.63 TRINITY_DN38556_c0_g1_i1:32-334(-)